MMRCPISSGMTGKMGWHDVEEVDMTREPMHKVPKREISRKLIKYIKD